MGPWVSEKGGRKPVNAQIGNLVSSYSPRNQTTLEILEPFVLEQRIPLLQGDLPWKPSPAARTSRGDPMKEERRGGRGPGVTSTVSEPSPSSGAPPSRVWVQFEGEQLGPRETQRSSAQRPATRSRVISALGDTGSHRGCRDAMGTGHSGLPPAGDKGHGTGEGSQERTALK